MKILPLLNYNTYSNYSNRSKQQNKIIYPYDSVYFGNSTARSHSELKVALADLIKEDSVHFHSGSINERISAYMERNKALRDLNDEFKQLDELLSSSDASSIKDDEKVIVKFIKQMKNLGKDKGFNKLAGYNGVKKQLTDNFIYKSVMMSKTSQKATVPNSVLFYGPSGNGKTSFAKALAEQSLSDVKIINCGDYPPEQSLKLIKSYLNNAKKLYENSGNELTRTIIVLNEAENLLDKSSPVFDEIKDLIPTVSEKYYTTFFNTSNFPECIDESILNSSITPIKTVIKPADYETSKLIVDKILADMNINIGDTTPLVNTLFRNIDQRYSNSSIKSIIIKTAESVESPDINDFIKSAYMVRQNINKKQMDKLSNQIKFISDID